MPDAPVEGRWTIYVCPVPECRRWYGDVVYDTYDGGWRCAGLPPTASHPATRMNAVEVVPATERDNLQQRLVMAEAACEKANRMAKVANSAKNNARREAADLASRCTDLQQRLSELKGELQRRKEGDAPCIGHAQAATEQRNWPASDVGPESEVEIQGQSRRPSTSEGASGG